ncbi:MAG: ATP synthase subunit I [Rhodospirillales bacterium]
MEAEELIYEQAVGRIYRGMKWLAGAVALAALPFLGGLWALAFLLGAAASYLNFAWLHQVVNALGPNARPARKRVFWFVALRYLLLGGAGYVIVKVFGLNVIAALSGLFVPVVAVIGEILYELIHDRA